MYNLFVSGQDDAWKIPVYEWDISRALREYISPALKERFSVLTAQRIDELKSFPTMFTYEGDAEEVRIGYLRTIRERGRSVVVEYEMDESIAPFTFDLLKSHLIRLDIERWEMNRTHWTVKDEDLFGILSAAGLVDVSYVGVNRQHGRVEEMQFKVALSFAGEQRAYVAEVANELKRRLGPNAVFYDKDFTAQLARPNLDTLLQRIYLKNSELVVVFLGQDYEQKQWCGLEWRAVRTIIKNKNDAAVMLMRFDRADVSGTFEIDGFVDLEEFEPIQTARLIVERVRLNELPPLPT